MRRDGWTLLSNIRRLHFLAYTQYGNFLRSDRPSHEPPPTVCSHASLVSDKFSSIGGDCGDCVGGDQKG